MKIGPILAAAAVLMAVPSANAQTTCAPRGSAVLQLETQFKEQLAGQGLIADGERLLELFISESGTWTVIVSEPGGRSCLLAAGENWQEKTLLLGNPV